jgi:tetratricopeptide (TPR) repeat protein
LKWLTYGAVFVAAARLARNTGSHRGLLVVIGSGLLGGLLSVAHGLAGVDEWLFVYRPQYARPPWAVAPLLNPNNFAGYLNLSLFAAMGVFFAHKPKLPRWVSATTVVLLAALVILTGSRGGVLALLVGFLLAGVAFRFQQSRTRYRQNHVLPTWVPLTVVGLAATGLAIIGATDLVWEQLLDETTGKLRIIEYSKAIVIDHLWFGVGRGAFGTTFAAYRQVLGDSIAQYAENFVVQWLVEWGLPVSLFGLVGLFWSMRRSSRDFGRNAQQTGAILAVFVLLIHNLVDLATEIPSVAIAAFALLGTVFGTTSYLTEKENRTKAVESRRVVHRSLPATLIAFSCLVPAIAAWGLVAKTGIPDVIEQRRRLSEEFNLVVGKPKGSPEFSRLRAHVNHALLRSPADPYVPLLGALLTRESGHSPYVWLNQALRRDPLSARPHLLLADTLNARGAKNQALFELRTTARLAPTFVGAVAERAIAWAPEYEHLLRVVPDGNDGISVLTALAQRQTGSKERLLIRQKLLALAIQRNPDDFQANAILADDLFAALDANQESCMGDARKVCEERLRRIVGVIVASKTHPQYSLVYRARLLAHEQNYDKAESLLAEHCNKSPDSVSCNRLRVSYAERLPERSRFESAAMAFTASACFSPGSCAAAFDWLGNLEIGRNNLLLALSRFERAAEESPTADAWLKVAEVAARAGRYGRSETALMTARRLGGKPKTEDLERQLLDIRRSRMLQELGKQ